MDVKKIILKYRKLARKQAAKNSISGSSSSSRERELLKYNFDFSRRYNAIKKAHRIMHDGSFHDCKKCIKILAEEEVKYEDLLPRYGNLISVLENEAATEKALVERKLLPTQNDLLRWALKDAVLEYYQNLNYQQDDPVVESRQDDRLIESLAPDFDVIAGIWMRKLQELINRDDKYKLLEDEYKEVENDLSEKMRGSAFEKRLDRYRQEFMSKL